MKIFPAIDLKDGKAVRLFQGDYDKVTVYGENPIEIAEGFKKQGASNLHLVDLDGAKDGTLVNFDTIKKIVSGINMFVQVGGGIRDEQRIIQYLELGVGRVILGTVAVKDFDFLCDMVKKYGEKIAVGIDVKDEYVAINGWKEVTDIKGFEFCEKLQNAGVKTIIYTDISKDGVLQGTNMNAYDRLSKMDGLNIIASGGVSFENEIAELKGKGIYGAILGKAIYSGLLDLQRAITIAEN
jgi:phosphoribosylformimino-5-aminoimidazole carboxamide ribotide isomerase